MGREWTPSQKQAIELTGGQVVVSAAAGSGKTSVLVERAARIMLSDKPVPADRFLITTFTNAAADEMRGRLFSLLDERKNTGAAAARQALLARLSVIGTIDSFCASLIREHFAMLDIPADFTIADMPVMLGIKSRVIDEVMSELYAADTDFVALASLFDRAKNDRTAEKLLLRLHSFFETQPFPDDYRKRCEEAVRGPFKQTVYYEIILRRFVELLRQADAELLEAEALVAPDQNAKKQLDIICGDSQAARLALSAALEGECERGALFLAAHSFARLTLNSKADYYERAKLLRDSAKKRMTAAADLAEFLSADGFEADSELLAPAIAALFRGERLFSTRLDEKKREQGLYEYCDLERYALQLLVAPDGGKTEVAREVEARFSQIMIDEYQDTNDLQSTLYAAVSNADMKNTFVVGDIKQSIYRFRNAVPAIFGELKARSYPARMKRYPALVTLSENFRSTKQLTDSVNRVFAALMTQRTCGIDYTAEQLVCGSGKQTSDGVGMELLIAEKHSDLDQPRAVAARIRELHDSGFTVNTDSGARRCEWGDFCVLMRAPKERLDDYAEAFAEKGIPYALQRSGSFFESDEVLLLVDALEAIDNPRRSLPLMSLMISPRFGFTADEFLSLKPKKRGETLYYNLKTNESDARCAELLAFLRRSRAMSARLSPAELVAYLVEELKLEAVALSSDNSVALSSLRAFLEFAGSLGKNRSVGAAGIVRAVRRIIESDASVGSVPLARGDAVAITSVHSSKGLEWPVVVLAETERRFNTSDRVQPILFSRNAGVGVSFIDARGELRVRRQTAAHKALAMSEQESDNAEQLRLLYVALTRARDKIIVFGAVENPEKLRDSFYKACELDIATASSVLPLILSSLSPLVDYDKLKVGFEGDGLAARFYCPKESEPLIEDESPPDYDTAKMLAERIRFVYPNTERCRTRAKISVSELTKKRDTPSVARPSFTQRAGMTGAERGTAIHEFMQYADYSLARESVKNELRRLAFGRYISAVAASGVDVAALERLFSGEIMRRIQKSPRVLREYEFFYELSAAVLNSELQDERIMVQGIADCIFEEDGALVVVDYKSDRVQAAETLVERYAEQLRVYKEAVAARLAMPVKECLIYSFALGKTIRVL